MLSLFLILTGFDVIDKPEPQSHLDGALELPRAPLEPQLPVVLPVLELLVVRGWSVLWGCGRARGRDRVVFLVVLVGIVAPYRHRRRSCRRRCWW